MSEEESEEVRLYVACPHCISFASTDSVDAGADSAESHNTIRHSGEDVARTVNVRDEEDLREFIEAAKEQAPGDEYTNFIRRLRMGNAPFFCPAESFREVVPKEDRPY